MNKANKYGDSQLMLALRNGKLELFRFLKKIGANINNLNTKNDTDLHLNNESNCVNIIKIL